MPLQLPSFPPPSSSPSSPPSLSSLARWGLLAALVPGALAQLVPSPTYTPPDPNQGTVSSDKNASPNPQWSSLLGNSLWFYDAQRSGRLSQGAYGNRVEWRNDSCTADGGDWNVDLSGGWYDAGDYIKNSYPLTFTLFALSWGGLSYGPGFDSSKQTAYLDGTLRWGYDWLIKSHPTDDVMFMHVGSNEVDNAYWGGDQNIPTPRPAFPLNASAPGTDAWASASAAFSLGSLLYTPGTNWNTSSSSWGPASLSNSSYASALLGHAQSLYKLASTTTPMTTFAKSLPAIKSAYASSGWGDDLTVAGLALAIATNQSSYYAEAYDNYKKYALTGKQAVWNWDSRTPAAYVLFAEAATARPGLAAGAGLDANLTGWQRECETYFDAIVTNKMNSGFMTDGGLLYYNGDSDEASLNPAMAAAALMQRYAPLASSADKAKTYQQFAASQVDYLLGNNPMSRVYVVGQHPNSPQNPHSGLASGGSNLNAIRSDPPTNVHTLYGAVPGGPLKNDKFWDYRDDWVTNEIALDYNANLPALAAYGIASGAEDPYYVKLKANSVTIPGGKPCDAALPCGGASPGAKAGIAVGVICAILIPTIFFCWWKRDRIRKTFRR